MSSTDEYLAILPTLSLAVAGINIVWGIFLYPFGLLGFAFATGDLYLFFLSLKIKDDYEAREYEASLRKLRIFVPIGFVSGLIVLGVVSRNAQTKIEDIMAKKYLIRSSPKIFSPPQFPGKKN